MQLAIVVQARAGSTRLPNKAILDFSGHHSILELIVERLKLNRSAVPVVVATTTESADDAIVEISEHAGVPVYRGSTTDVLARFVATADYFGFDWIIRVCADNPFLHLPSIDALVEKCGDADFDYLSFEAAPGLPAIRSHLGLYAELVSFNALRRAGELSQNPADTEHVTKFIYENPDKFRIQFLTAHPEVFGRRDLRFTVDDLTDFKLMQQLYSEVVDIEGIVDLRKLVNQVDSQVSYLDVMKSQIKLYTK
jgi:spore coat polysaccharide biosynthesis protein SpsF